MLDTSECMDTNDHNQSQPLQQKPVSSQQSLTSWTFARHVPPYAVTVISRNQHRKKTKDFLSSEKITKAKNKKNNDDFREVIIFD